MKADPELAATLLEMGKLNLKENLLNEARENFQEALELYKTLGDKEKKSECFWGLSELYRKQAEAENGGSTSNAVASDERSSVLLRITSELNSYISLREILDRLLSLTIETVMAERGIILLWDDRAKDFKIEVSVSELEPATISDVKRYSIRIINKAAREKTIIFSSDARSDPRFSQYKSVIDYNIVSFVCLPLLVRDEIVGTMYLDHRRAMEGFSEKDIELVMTIRNLASAAIEKSRLIEKLNRENTEKAGKIMFLEQQNFSMLEEIKDKSKLENIVGVSPGILKVKRMMTKLMELKEVYDLSVLIQGESGTGKELAAAAIHYGNDILKNNRFVAVDCGAITGSLAESELFGIKEKTATGVEGKKGLVEWAAGGTLFLDEIGSAGQELQARLPRFLEERKYRPVGSREFSPVNVMVVVATYKDLPKLVEKRAFRKDLYYRLSHFVIHLPPLRKRKEDIPLLIKHFIDEFNERYDKHIQGIDQKVFEAFQRYSWPGNVRELKSYIRRAVIMTDDNELTEELFPRELFSAAPVEKPMDDLEKEILLKRLKLYKGNISRAARSLGFTEGALRYRMKKFEIDASAMK